MPQQIDEQLLRKRAEHNDGDLSTLREVTLHQFDIERIENLDKYCRNLEILYLQCNQISRIENLGKLKRLQYLQLSLNNITTIENLEGCESLEKLDLTVNFVGDPLCVESLKGNIHLRELFLVGNPCTDVPGYREFVITTLPQLRLLDSKEIEKSERILAAQEYPAIREALLKRRAEKLTAKDAISAASSTSEAAASPTEESEHYLSRNAKATPKASTEDNTQESKQIDSPAQAPEPVDAPGTLANSAPPEPASDDLERRRLDFQNKPVPHTPEARLAAARDLAALRESAPKNGADFADPTKRKKERILFAPDGRVLQKNEGKYLFKWHSTPSTLVLTVEISKFLDTSLIDVDVHPTWIRVTIKAKILQLVMEEEVQTTNVACERSKLTGQLAVTMVKASVVGDVHEIRSRERLLAEQQAAKAAEAAEANAKAARPRGARTNPLSRSSLRQTLEPSGDSKGRLDYKNIFREQATHKTAPDSRLLMPGALAQSKIVDAPIIAADIAPDETFRDNPDVPPLC
ncbi:hypothetical protein HK105_203365 [Polyrhizophydium stewartii]|uniref:U2A'/phosphoprotein 32 family A C-terminal domain-containing protein n=1 Tax=Polyrhizophydium stewartii TaxID=2732419 RepID=A0ABR4NBL7_9FUNG